MLKEKIRKA
jgi:hypothetical protein